MSFDLDKQLIKIQNVNARMERHGEDNVLAIDIAIEARMSNDVLSMFHPTLKNSLYWKDESVQGELIDDIGYAPNLRFPLMGTIKWASEMHSVQFRVHHGVRDDDDIVFSEAKADHFKLVCQEGGTVAVQFRVQARPTEKDAAKMLTLINSEVHVSLIDEMGDGMAANDEFPEAA